jgi:hypothetical protein
MANYKETSVTGSYYQRAYQVVINNPLGGVPNITFFEEEVMTLADGRQLKNNVAGCLANFQHGATFPLINPLDDTSLGAMGSHDQVQVLLYSLYKALRAQADAPKV